MILHPSAEALEFGKQALRAFDAAGGDELLQKAEADPSAREKLVAPVLDGLGATELDPRDDSDSMEAAAALCRSAGYRAVPYPVAEMLSRPAELTDRAGLVVVAGPAPSAALAGLTGRWATTTLDGEVGDVTGMSAPGPQFVTAVETVPTGAQLTSADVALALVLPCWTLLGMFDRAIDLTVAHVTLRRQFDRPLSSFQSVQFQLTDAEVERSGLDVLAAHALWSAGEGHADALDDALALRLAAIEAADIVFRVCHQLHGAVGFCDETALSWISRHSRPLRRLPLGRSATEHELTRRIGRHGLTGLFGGTAGLEQASVAGAVGAVPGHGVAL